MVRYRPPKDWQQWVEWLAAGLHGRNRWRLSLIFLGIVFARRRRTVTTLPRRFFWAASKTRGSGFTWESCGRFLRQFSFSPFSAARSI